MIDTADLPPRVRDEVIALDGHPPAAIAGQLRVQAAYSYQWVHRFWHQHRWDLVFGELGLLLGYLTAACRVEEPAGPSALPPEPQGEPT